MYKRLYGIESSILTNVINIDDFISVIKNSQDKYKDNKFTILYTGSVYGAQFDAIDNLVKALDIVNKPRIICQFHLYSNLSPSFLKKIKWSRSYVEVKKTVTATDLPVILGNADLLFLPLSFKSEWSFTVQTSAPGKLAEYAGSGRPILIHAPPYADISILGKERCLGIVIDTPDPQELAKAIISVLKDKQYAARLGQQALEAAREYYNQPVVQQRLYKSLEQIVHKSPKRR